MLCNEQIVGKNCIYLQVTNGLRDNHPVIFHVISFHKHVLHPRAGSLMTT